MSMRQDSETQALSENFQDFQGTDLAEHLCPSHIHLQPTFQPQPSLIQ